jgi:hypothetical protein
VQRLMISAAIGSALKTRSGASSTQPPCASLWTSRTPRGSRGRASVAMMVAGSLRRSSSPRARRRRADREQLRLQSAWKHKGSAGNDDHPRHHVERQHAELVGECGERSGGGAHHERLALPQAQQARDLIDLGAPCQTACRAATIPLRKPSPRRRAKHEGGESSHSEPMQIGRDQNSAGKYPLISRPMQISTRVGVVQAIGRFP